ncbi:MAG: glutathione S-transferase N-terminal domain-containing protein [Firmicutes bacterium]|nr:glutathione S-transferase N-terminal domain-containing protein [Bacillota bacterium]
MNITVYSTSTCPWCTKAKDYLKSKGVDYKEVNVGIDREGAIEMVKKSGQQGVPVIDIDGTIIIGFDQRRIDSLITQ